MQPLYRVVNYAFAKNLVKKTTPIRGTNIIPLGDRRYHNRYRLEVHGESVHFIYHATAVLRVYPDETLIIDPDGWHTMTTAQLLNKLVPQGQVYMRLGKIVYRLRGKEYLCDIPGGLVVKWVDGEYRVSNPSPCVVHTINRRKMNAVRQQYAAFLTFAKGWCALRKHDDGCIYVRNDETTPEGRPTLERLIESDEPEDHYCAVLTFAKLAKNLGKYWTVPPTPHKVMTEINNFLLKLHAEHVLDRVELPEGVIRADRYRTY